MGRGENMKLLKAFFIMISIALLGTGIADPALRENGFSSNMWPNNALSSNQLSSNGHSNGSSSGVSIGLSNGISRSVVSNIPPINQGAAANISKPADTGSPAYEAYPSTAVDLSAIARSEALSEFFNDYIEWCMSNPDSTSVNDIGIFATTNQQDNTVSYIQGLLKYRDETGVFEGTGKQYFNNRMWNLDTLTNRPQMAAPMALYPFDPTKTDIVDLALDTSRGVLTVKHASSGGEDTVDLEAANGVLFGFSGLGYPSIYTISLNEHKSPA